MKKKKRQQKTELSAFTWMLVLIAVPFVILHWYIEGRYQKKNAPELESSLE